MSDERNSPNVLSDTELALLTDELGFEPTDYEQFIEAAIDDPRQWDDTAQELETMAKGAKALLALWRRERS